jgi:DNA-binding GntR family transcriptional regulator
MSIPSAMDGGALGLGGYAGQISRESLSQQAYVAIRQSLMRSRLRPGQKLIARQVADELGISVTPVRESLLRLVSENALALDDRGTVIVPEVTLARCIEIRDLRMLVEGEGAARAAGRATDAEIDALELIHQRYVATEQDANFDAALMENEDFHFTLCRLAGLRVLSGIVENLWIQFGPVLSFLYDGGQRPFHGRTHGHILVIEALRSRDQQRAREAIAKDILIGGQVIVEKLTRLAQAQMETT